MKLIKEVGWGFYLGASLSILAGVNFMMWEFYVILVPTAILVVIKDL